MYCLSYDVENLVRKVFAEFSNSAKKTEQLKQCFEVMNLEYQNVLRHTPTRWLSLFKAVERLILSWPAIKSYFLELGEDNCHKEIWNFIKDQENEMENDLSSYLSISEIYLYFVHHYMNLMTQTLLTLERNTITCTEVDEVLQSLKTKLETRIEDSFFSSKVNQALKHHNQNKVRMFTKEA